MKSFIKKNSILLAAIILSLAAVGVLLCFRITAESKNKNIAVIMSYSHIEMIAKAQNISTVQCLQTFRDMGLAAVTLSDDWGEYDNTAATNINGAGLGLILTPSVSFDLGKYEADRQRLKSDFPLFLPTGGFMLDYGENNDEAVASLTGSGIALGLIENKLQTGHVKIQDFDTMEQGLPMVRVFKLYYFFQRRYAVLGYDSFAEIENIIYRALTDRNIRVLWLTPFKDSDSNEMISAIDDYAQLFANLKTRVAPHGLVIGDDFSVIEDYHPSPILRCFCYFGLLAMGILLLETLIKLSVKIKYMLFIGGCITLTAGELVLSDITCKAAAFVGTTLVPCVVFYFLLQLFKALYATKKKLSVIKVSLISILTLAATLFILLIGGGYVGAILSSSKFTLEIDAFRGVKLSQMGPLVYAAILIFIQLFYRKGVAIKTQITDAIQGTSRQRKVILLCGALLLAMAIALFILRTGDRILSAGVLEQHFRNLLENQLMARPRTKEFLIAWPALIAGIFFASRKFKNLSALMLFTAAIGCASVCNTFCHLRAYFMLSVNRSIIGAILGLIIGLIFSLLIVAPIFTKRLKQYSAKPAP